jgi:predicted kinase
MNELMNRQEILGRDRENIALATGYFYMDESHRQEMLRALTAGEVDRTNLWEDTRSARIDTVEKIAGVGMTIPTYLEALALLGSENFAQLQVLFDNSRAFMSTKEEKVVSTKELNSTETGYTQSRQVLHDQILKEKTEGLTSSPDPRIVFILGVPGAGKTELRAAFQSENPNFMLSDLDTYRGRLIQGYDDSNIDHVLATQEEVTDIAYKALQIAFENKFNIVCETTLRGEEWLRYMLDGARDYKKEFILVHSRLAECLRRVIAFRDRPVSLDFLLSAFNSGYKNFFETVFPNLNFDVTVVDNNRDNPLDSALLYRRVDGQVLNADDSGMQELIHYAIGVRKVRSS